MAEKGTLSSLAISNGVSCLGAFPPANKSIICLSSYAVKVVGFVVGG